MKIGPISTWPGALSTSRQYSPFRAGLSDTLKVLDRELWNLVDTRAQQDSAELLIAIPAGGFRIDGRPRADARAEHPGVILSLDSKFGHLSYPCDTFTTWQDNLWAIALALEALRKVDRYGVTKRGEQYRGFLELEATAAPAGFSSSTDAIVFLKQQIPFDWTTTDGTDASSLRTILHQAQRATHPDHGGDSAIFQRVSLAEARLRTEGRL